jgi:hypothetical protein
LIITFRHATLPLIISPPHDAFAIISPPPPLFHFTPPSIISISFSPTPLIISFISTIIFAAIAITLMIFDMPLLRLRRHYAFSFRLILRCS